MNPAQSGYISAGGCDAAWLAFDRFAKLCSHFAGHPFAFGGAVALNTQNRDSAAVQIKLDELIRAVEGAHNGLLALENLSESELEAFREKYVELAEEARKEIRASDTGTPEIHFPAEARGG